MNILRLLTLALLLVGATGAAAQNAPVPDRNQTQTFVSYTQLGRAIDISVTTASFDEVLGVSGPVAVVYNSGSNWAYVLTSTVASSVTEATGIPVGPGSCAFINSQGMGHIQAITATGSTTLQIGVGWGNPGSCGGGGSGGGGGGGNVNLTQILSAAPSATNPLWMAPASGAVFPVSGSVDITGTLPAFASPPTVNIGTAPTIAVTGTFWPYTLGQQVNGSSVPVVLTAAQLSTLTPPAAITNYALETGGNLANLYAAMGSGSSPAANTLQARLATLNTTLGTPFQAGGSIGNTSFGISGTLPAFAATPTVNIGTAPTITVTGSVTANAGTNLNTSLLALETGGNLASINTKTPALGQALAAGSVPVVLTAAQITALTPLTSVAVTNAGTFAVQAAQSGTWTNTVTQATGTNLHMVCDSGCSSSSSPSFGSAFPATGTPIGMSQGGNLTAFTGTGGSVNANITNTVPVTLTSTTITGSVAVTGTFWPYSLGQQLAAASVPIVLTAAQLTTLTPPAAITNYSLETGGNLATLVTDFGAPGATACTTDTASCNLNQQMQRNSQRLTTINTTLGTPFQAGGSIGNTTFAATQATASALNATVVGNGTFAVQAAQSGTWNIGSITTLPALVAGSAIIGKVGIDQTTVGTTNGVSLAQIGATTVATGNGVSGAGSQRVNIASDNTAFSVNATLQASSATAIGTVNPTTIGNWGLQVSTQNSATPTNGGLVLGQFNTSPTTITSGNVSPFQLDSAGNLLVNIKAGASSGAVAQGSTTAGQSGGLTQAAVTASSPSYTTAQTSPMSLTLAGALRVDASATTQPVSSSTLGTAANQATIITALATLNTTAGNPLATQAISNVIGGVGLNATPTLANGNGVVPTQGGSVLSATNGMYTNLLQGNAVLATANPLFASISDGITKAKVEPASTPAATTDAALAVAPLPSELHLGEIGSNQIKVDVAQTVTASAYTTGNAIGGLMTVAGAARVSGTSGASGTGGVLTGLMLDSKSVQSVQVDVFIFDGNPTSSTCTDKTGFVLATADANKVVGVLTIPSTAVNGAGWFSGGTGSLGIPTYYPITYSLASSTTLYGCAVARGAFTPASTSDVSFKWNMLRS